MNAHLLHSNLLGADLRDVDLRGIVFNDDTVCFFARFNSATRFGEAFGLTWEGLPESEKEAARAPWIARGMINIDAPPVADSSSA